MAEYIETTRLPDWAFAHKAPPHGVPFLFRSHDQSARLPGFRNVRLVVHQKPEGGTSDLKLLGWMDGS